MKQVALIQDPTPATVAKMDLPLFRTSSTSHSFPTPHALNNSHFYLTLSVSQFSSNPVQTATMKVFHMLQPTDSSDDHLGLCTGED